jgi:PAS domain S-box-containing protein
MGMPTTFVLGSINRPHRQQEHAMAETRYPADPSKPRSPLEQALNDAAERTELALAACNMGIWSLDAATQAVALDNRARAIWCLPDSVTTCTLSELEAMVHPDDRAKRQTARQKGLDPNGDGHFVAEYRIAAHELHSERWVAVQGQTTFLQGRAVRMIGTVRDITARKTVEQQLRTSQEALSLRKSELEAEVTARTRQLEAMHDAAVNAILTIDPRGAIQSINVATTQLLGYAREELIGQNVKMIMPDPYAREHDRYLKAYLDTGKKKIIGIGREVTARRKDGTTLPIHLAVSEFEANGNRFFTGIITDLSERKSAEVALQETERKLAQSQKMEAVGQLTGGLAHDFNNLLTIIIGNLELLDMRLDDEGDRDLIRRADEAARMGARLTGRLLTFGRRGALQPTVVNLNDTTVGMTELLRRSLGEAVTVTSELASDLWKTRLDAGEIENAILNLALNARDAMPNGGRILIETDNVTLTKDDLAQSPDALAGDFVKLTVSDEGTGMPPEVVARAFEPFFTTKEAGRGTGLGLSTIFGFVKQSGGHANIYSEVGKGTAVSLYLPRDASSVLPETRKTSIPDLKTAVGEIVLVVEDNEEVRDLTVRRLGALGYTVLVAGTGPEALAILEKRTDIDLVFSDVVMPGGVSGFDIARWVKQHKPQLKILLTSGFAPEMANHGAALPADITLLRKPYKQADLARAIRETLTR